MQLSIILVSTNAREHIAKCLEALRMHSAGVEYEVIVADNASTDGTPEMIATQFPWVKLVRNPRNLGFGTANNRAATVATGEYLCFFNDDTIVTGNILPTIYAYMQSHPQVGCMGFHLVFPDSAHQDSVRTYPTLSDQTMILLKMHHLFPRAKCLRKYLCTDFDYRKEQDVDQVMGACMVIPRATFERVGGFDEQFFVWFEEVDLQKRIREMLGQRVVYAPIAEMIHVKGATFGKALSMYNQRRFNESARYYFKKHHSRFAYIVISVCTIIALCEARVVQFIEARGLSLRKKRNQQL